MDEDGVSRSVIDRKSLSEIGTVVGVYWSAEQKRVNGRENDWMKRVGKCETSPKNCQITHCVDESIRRQTDGNEDKKRVENDCFYRRRFRLHSPYLPSQKLSAF